MQKSKTDLSCLPVRPSNVHRTYRLPRSCLLSVLGYVSLGFGVAAATHGSPSSVGIDSSIINRQRRWHHPGKPRAPNTVRVQRNLRQSAAVTRMKRHMSFGTKLMPFTSLNTTPRTRPSIPMKASRELGSMPAPIYLYPTNGSPSQYNANRSQSARKPIARCTTVTWTMWHMRLGRTPTPFTVWNTMPRARFYSWAAPSSTSCARRSIGPQPDSALRHQPTCIQRH